MTWWWKKHIESRWVATSAITVFTCRLFSCFYQFFSFCYLLGEKLAPISAAPLMPVPSLVPVLSVQPSGDTQRTASGSWGGCKVSDAETSTYRCTVPAGLIAASWWFNLHIFLPSACLSISFISILRINLSLVPSARTGWGQCLYIFHCNLGSLKCSILTEIVPALHCLLLEMLLNFWCMLRQLIMDKAWLYQETSDEWLL